MSRKTKGPDKAGAVELSETQLDQVQGGGAPVGTKGYFKGVSGLDPDAKSIEFQDGDDLFLRKPPPRGSSS